MDRNSDPIYSQHCKWESVVIRKCRLDESCGFRMQNFRSVYDERALTVDARVGMQIAAKLGTIRSPTSIGLSSALTTGDGRKTVEGVVTDAGKVVGALVGGN
jgi:hypothetical protein